ncbi:MAG: L,D-transpeptidase [Candidatus Aminicenantes bacterium]|uniref:ErfK/YbiS/YcfS/YnhG family protein n=1 Tax=Candidatus Saccharicenans subterraneus TaxID=2508984 RepID=A0A3E2BJ30_9BACT|nr:L,D-transpeptidase [Candidatus Aminicenantes bacterium]RFT14735.1 MAG: ErfK/YbiS/YcfS/YnhG family protein [Candidatus Saccharicenans subterraneum]
MKFWKVLLALVALVYLSSLAIVALSWMHHLKLSAEWKTVWSFELDPKARVKPEAQNAALKKKIQELHPKGVYIMVDSAENRLYLKKDGQTIKEALVSTGSGVILVEPGGKRSWQFDTPKGEFFVKSKIQNPYWVKPDWAFIEENEPIPKKMEDRVEAGVLGDYALGFGQGYFIHGTLYTRLLGRNVTHGCVRVADKDLEEVFKASRIGTRIYIY